MVVIPENFNTHLYLIFRQSFDQNLKRYPTHLDGVSILYLWIPVDKIPSTKTEKPGLLQCPSYKMAPEAGGQFAPPDFLPVKIL